MLGLSNCNLTLHLTGGPHYCYELPLNLRRNFVAGLAGIKCNSYLVSDNGRYIAYMNETSGTFQVIDGNGNIPWESAESSWLHIPIPKAHWFGTGPSPKITF